MVCSPSLSRMCTVWRLTSICLKTGNPIRTTTRGDLFARQRSSSQPSARFIYILTWWSSREQTRRFPDWSRRSAELNGSLSSSRRARPSYRNHPRVSACAGRIDQSRDCQRLYLWALASGQDTTFASRGPRLVAPRMLLFCRRRASAKDCPEIATCRLALQMCFILSWA